MTCNRVFNTFECGVRFLTLKTIVAVLLLIVVISSSKIVSAQVIWAGVKAGTQINFVKFDTDFRDSVNAAPTLGFNAGGALSFRVKDRYFLQTEYTYSLKRKTIAGNKKTYDPQLNDKVSYHYFEVPVLFTMQFKVRLGGEKTFKCYLGGGPNIAYLVAARGRIKSGHLLENGISSQRYKVEFGDRENRDHNNIIYYPRVNRFQFGINLGGGMILEPAPKRKVIIDIRYTFDQTLFGKKKADYTIPLDYDDNLRFRNRTARVSVIYVLQYNLNKKERNLGKSTNSKSR